MTYKFKTKKNETVEIRKSDIYTVIFTDDETVTLVMNDEREYDIKFADWSIINRALKARHEAEKAGAEIFDFRLYQGEAVHV